jgi:hypothetical protein
MAYFEGNDLHDAAAYEQANPFILNRFGRYMLVQIIEAWHKSRPGEAQAVDATNYRYPILVTIHDTNMEMAFFSYYISWLSVSGEEIAKSRNYHIVEETILKINDACQASESRFLLVYVPSKEHIYLPYVNDTETMEKVFSDVPALKLDKDGFLQFTSQKTTEEVTRKQMGDQSHLLAGFASENSIDYLDLTSWFQEEASEGVELYYPFDTHWNQGGHNLAARTIANYIEGL